VNPGPAKSEQREQTAPPDTERRGDGHVAGLDELLAPAGWAYASAAPVEPGDPGRFHALFGRDALVTSLQVLPVRPDVARATLRMLASLQGRRDDPEIDEEPGKIVHEWWPRAPTGLLRVGWPVRGGELRYYGSADSTPWFLVVLASLADPLLEAELEGAWRAAAGWLKRALERGGGLVRHGPRRGPGGLAQQGWRDTVDPSDPDLHGAGILRPDGEPPSAPLADADTQAVAIVALRSVAALSGDEHWRQRSEQLAGRVHEAFGADTIAVEVDGSTVSGAGSHLGWLLWADALSAGARDRAAERLCRRDVLTPWGLRTLSTEHPLYAPDAYHRGAVWPFDSWLGWGGLRTAGRGEVAQRLRQGVLTAIETLGRAPELYAVGPDGPEPIPIANRVQAWTVGARWALEHEWDGRAPRVFW
jgi:glycogen debranching enzyme